MFSLILSNAIIPTRVDAALSTKQTINGEEHGNRLVWQLIFKLSFGLHISNVCD